MLQAWLIADRKEEVYQAALNAKSEEEAGEAIHMLGAMGAVDELRKLGDRPNASQRWWTRMRSAAISRACARSPRAAANARVRSRRCARSASSRAMRRARALREIYSRSTDAEIKEAALQGMLIADDEQGVLALYRAAKIDRGEASAVALRSR